MCTVTFYPLSEGGYILCSNRDERMSRSDTMPPAAFPNESDCFYFPRDKESSGTWIAASSSGKTFCLLNGAFEAHKPSPPYKRSRGLVLLDILASEDPEKFPINPGFAGVEPFTLIMIRKLSQTFILNELRWDGSQYHVKDLDNQIPHIWSSSTLYPPEVRIKREQWFNEWQTRNPSPGLNDLLLFHSRGGSGDQENDLIMSRSNDRQTISITAVEAGRNQKWMHHHNLITDSKSAVQIF
jgi:hypothetical protein